MSDTPHGGYFRLQEPLELTQEDPQPPSAPPDPNIPDLNFATHQKPWGRGSRIKQPWERNLSMFSTSTPSSAAQGSGYVPMSQPALLTPHTPSNTNANDGYALDWPWEGTENENRIGLLMTPVSPECIFQLPPHPMADPSCERLASVPGLPSHSTPPIEAALALLDLMQACIQTPTLHQSASLIIDTTSFGPRV